MGVEEENTLVDSLCSVRPGNEVARRKRQRARERPVIGQRLLFAILPVGLHGVWAAVGKKVEKGRKV